MEHPDYSNHHPKLDNALLNQSMDLKTSREQIRPFNKIFQVGSCGANMENLIFQLGEKDDCLMFGLPDDINSNRGIYHETLLEAEENEDDDENEENEENDQDSEWDVRGIFAR